MRVSQLPLLPLAALVVVALAGACEDDDHMVTDDVGLTELWVDNSTDVAIEVSYEAVPYSDITPPAGTLTVAANEAAKLVEDWAIGGWLQPDSILSSIKIRDADTQELLYEQAPVTNDDWELADGGSWRRSEYTLTIAR